MAAYRGNVCWVMVLVWCYQLVGINGQVCQGTGSPPRKTLGLTFCQRFSDNACCTPALDAENEEMFENLINVGASCRARGNVLHHPMAEFYCLNCAPTQPQFVVGTVVYICKEWADDKFGTGDDLFTRYHLDQCGLYVAGACPGRDRYQCGDDLIIPAPNATSDGAVDIVRTVEELLNYANIGPPLFEEGYTFRVVASNELPSGVQTCYSAASISSPQPLLVAPTLLLLLLGVLRHIYP